MIARRLCLLLVWAWPSVAAAQLDNFLLSKRLNAPASRMALPGDAVEYELALFNRTDLDSPAIEILDPIDPNLEAVSAPDGMVDAAQGTVLFRVPSLPPRGVVRLLVSARVRADVPPGTVITNQYGARDVSQPRFVVSDDIDTPEVDDPVELTVLEAQGAALSLGKTVVATDGAFVAGAPIAYTLTVTNVGARPVTDVVITDTLASAITNIAAPQGRVQGASRTVVFDQLVVPALARLPVGGVVRVQITGTIDRAAGLRLVVNNQAVLSSPDVASDVLSDDPGTPAPDDPTRFIVQRAMALPAVTSFTKRFRVLGEDPSRAQVGEEIEWSLVMVNTNAVDVTDLFITDVVPARSRYVPNTMTLDGSTRTDAVADDDGGSFDGDQLNIRVPSLRAGQTREFVFRTVVDGGPSISNQARLFVTGNPPELSDNNDEERDGNSPTVAPVGQRMARELKLEKVLVSSDGAPPAYRLTVSNTGTIAHNQVIILDDLPPELAPGEVEAPEGSNVSIQGQQVVITGLAMEVGATAEILVQTTVRDGVAQGAEICNTASADASGAPRAVSGQVCFRLPSVVGPLPGQLSGQVFEDADLDGAFTPGVDERATGMELRLVAVGGASSQDRRASSDDLRTASNGDGGYVFADLNSGRYALLAYSETGTLLGQSAPFDVPDDGGDLRLDLPIGPSGRIYDSSTGDPIAGARVFVYRELDADDDPFDVESIRSRQLVSAEDLEDASQQGQLTDSGGRYRVRLNQAGRYALIVEPPGARYLSPSVLFPSTGSAILRDEIRVGTGFLPPTQASAPHPHSLLLRVERASSRVYWNHLPLDPLASLLDLQLEVLRDNVPVGGVATFQALFGNRSVRALDGVYLEALLPAGLKYVAGSAVLVRLDSGRPTPLAADDPKGERRLRFGQVEVNAGRKIQTPLRLAAGEQIRLRFQAAVGADALAGQDARVIARVLDTSSAGLGGESTATLHIAADSEFDESVIVGKVYCDEDRDGQKAEGEGGLPGVWVLMDQGKYAVTDRDGHYHFDAADAGTHVVHLDADTLLPGSEMTTDELRVMSFTSGLPGKLDFGVTCPSESVDRPTVSLHGMNPERMVAALRERVVLVTGNVETLSLSAGGTELRAAAPSVRLLVDEAPVAAPDLVAGGRGALARLAFELTVPAGAPRGYWSLYVSSLGGDDELIAEGDGQPPLRYDWDQRGSDGRPLLREGRVYAYRLEIGDREGRLLGSPAGTFGVGASIGVDAPLVATLRGDFFGANGELKPALEVELRRLRETLLARGGTIELEVHGDDSLPGEAMAQRTQAQAERAAALLQKLLAQRPDRVVGKGQGSGRPVAPNLSERQRSRNRRVEIRVRPSDAAPRTWTPVAATYTPVVRAGKDEVLPDGDGDFIFVTDVPADGVVEVYLRGSDGRRATFPLRRHPGEPGSFGTPRVVQVRGTLPKGLSVGGQPVGFEATGLDVQGPERVLPAEVLQNRSLAFTTRGGEAVKGWHFSVVGPTGSSFFETAGEGGVPSALSVDFSQALPGDYVYRVSARLGALTLSQSPSHVLHFGPGGAAPRAPLPGTSRLWVDGRAASVSADGQLFAETTVRADEAILLEVSHPNDERTFTFVRPPAPILKASPTQPLGPSDGALQASNASRTSVPDGPEAGEPVSEGPYEKLDAATPKRRSPLSNEARQNLSEFGLGALMSRLQGHATSAETPDVPAAKLTVLLPKTGATLSGRTVPVRGTTAIGNRVYLGDVEVIVDDEGRFGGAATLTDDTPEVVVTAVDPEGNRGVIRRAVTAAESQWFLLALADSHVGASGAKLDGVKPQTSAALGESVYVHGRGVAYLRGRIKGSALLGDLFKEVRLTGHVDTARRRDDEPYFRQLVDSEAFYPVYGDAARVVDDAHSRGPVYVLIEADRSHFTAGNFKTSLRGVELFRYDRTLYGAMAKLDVDGQVGSVGLHHEVEAFVADLDLPERHAYVELRGTGGSLYYLPYREIIEGSEQVFAVVRDRDSGLERQRTPLQRDLDYTIRYSEGRLLLKRPLSSRGFAAHGVRPQVVARQGGVASDGDEQLLAIEFDHRDPKAASELSAGAHARESLGEHVSLGAGYVREARGAGEDAYTLWGVDATLRTGRRTHLQAEVVESRSINATNLISGDGGLTFEPFNTRDQNDAKGRGLLLRGGLELDDVLGEATADHFYSSGYAQKIEPGFHGPGTLSAQGLTRFGASSRWHLDASHQLHVEHDSLLSDDPEKQGGFTYRGEARHETKGGYTYLDHGLRLDVGFVRLSDEQGLIGGPIVTDSVGIGLEYPLDDEWTLLAEQDVVLIGDSRVHTQTTDLLASTVGARLRLDDELTLEGEHTLVWSGDNATRVGLRTQIDERHTMYVDERFSQTRQGGTASTVIGGEERWGDDQSGRSYGEYQLETGETGPRNRAVIGTGKRTSLMRGLTLDTGYERAQLTGEAPGGETSTDALSLGLEWLDRGWVKAAGRYELRYEDNDERTVFPIGRRDRVQVLALNSVDWRFLPDLTLLARINYGHTLDLDFDATEAELIEGSLGLSYRPLAFNDLIVLLKYTKRFEQLPVDVALELPVREESDVVALIPIIELPLNLQLVEKLAFKRYATRFEDLPTQVGRTLLWINRLNLHVTRTWDAGLEYRYLATTLAQNTRKGALAEINYIIKSKVRVGVGYNFTRFSDDEFARLDEDHGGPFFRVIGAY